MAAAGRGIAGRRFPAVVAAVTAVVDVIALRVVLAVVTKVLRKNGRAPAAQLSRIHGKENTRLRDNGGGGGCFLVQDPQRSKHGVPPLLAMPCKLHRTADDHGFDCNPIPSNTQAKAEAEAYTRQAQRSNLVQGGD